MHRLLPLKYIANSYSNTVIGDQVIHGINEKNDPVFSVHNENRVSILGCSGMEGHAVL
ncbi:hypothetical protein D3C85_1470250 [compost metagenome]